MKDVIDNGLLKQIRESRDDYRLGKFNKLHDLVNNNEIVN